MKRYIFIIWAWVFAMSILSSSVQAGFEDNGNDTVTDTVTGLVWQQRDDQNDAGGRSWEDALDYCECLNLGGRTDWRLPNVRELESLTDVDCYSPAIDPVFDCRSSNYWSGSTYAGYPGGAWRVYFLSGDVGGHNKTYGYYVRCVRSGPSGSFDYLDHFVISDVSSPQAVGSAFGATITAVDANGNRLWGFNGSVSLSSNLGGVSPTSVYLANGQGTRSVTLYNGGYTRLNCSGYGAYGNSNYFTVTGGSACNGEISGRVIDGRRDPVYEAEVGLYQGDAELHHTQTDMNGIFSFTGLDSVSYDFKIYRMGKIRWRRDVPSGCGSDPNYIGDIMLPINTVTYGTPVILLPGMMGSSRGKYSPYPKLGETMPDMHLHIHAPATTGFKALKEALEDDYYVYECPWDWRLTCEEAAEILKDVIDAALTVSTTGKVHVVAHSMGGLVARAHIQSAEYDNDIWRLAMVGTPHQGSCNPYYIWEGGDPKLIDDITDAGVFSGLNIYSNTIQNLWEETYGKKGWDNDKWEDIREFVRNKAPSLRQLMHTEEFLKDSSGKWDIDSHGNENNWLKELNDDPDITSLMSDDGDGGKVEVRIFVGAKSNSTVHWVKTEEQSSPWFRALGYDDGAPKYPAKKSLEWDKGDGTVPYDSATWPSNEGWASKCSHESNSSHAKLIKDFVGYIETFLNGGVADSSAVRLAEAEVPELSFALTGKVRILVTDPSGNHTGIDPATGAPVEEITGGSCIFVGETGSVDILDPAAGVYQVTYFGEAERNFYLDIGYADGDTTEIQQLRGFCPASARTFNVTVAPSSTPRITVTPLVEAPADLQADVYSSGGEKTRLSWTASGSAGVAGYNIYSVSEDEPYFALLTTVSGTTTYDTDHPWSSTDAVPVITYAVAAVNASGVESFFSNTAQNNDRDHDWATDAEEEILTTDPNVPDTDGDGLMDGEEGNYGTNAKFADTDGDGFNDGVEVKRGTDPLDAGSKPVNPMSWLLPLLLGN